MYLRRKNKYRVNSRYSPFSYLQFRLFADSETKDNNDGHIPLKVILKLIMMVFDWFFFIYGFAIVQQRNLPKYRGNTVFYYHFKRNTLVWKTTFYFEKRNRPRGVMCFARKNTAIIFFWDVVWESNEKKGNVFQMILLFILEDRT